ncbi:hypothetical protein CSB11_02480 [Candidatus Campbellbacteria bacterium]|nr:MAG: hypothetical protein CSB11_02480 [Candidatus Campbellbacteria bacterium]
MIYIRKIKRDPEDEPKYKFDIFDFLMILILFGGFLGILFVNYEKKEIKINGESQIKIIDENKEQLEEFIKEVDT